MNYCGKKPLQLWTFWMLQLRILIVVELILIHLWLLEGELNFITFCLLKFQWNHQIISSFLFNPQKKSAWILIDIKSEFFISRLNFFFVYSHQVNMRTKSEEKTSKFWADDNFYVRLYNKIVSAALKKKNFLLSHCLTLTFMFIALSLSHLLCSYTDWSVFEVIALSLCHYPWV